MGISDNPSDYRYNSSFQMVKHQLVIGQQLRKCDFPNNDNQEEYVQSTQTMHNDQNKDNLATDSRDTVNTHTTHTIQKLELSDVYDHM